MKVIDKKTGKEEEVVDATVNSYNVTQTKLSDKGINCTQWFSEKDFEKRFEIVKYP